MLGLLHQSLPGEQFGLGHEDVDFLEDDGLDFGERFEGEGEAQTDVVAGGEGGGREEGGAGGRGVDAEQFCCLADLGGEAATMLVDLKESCRVRWQAGAISRIVVVSRMKQPKVETICVSPLLRKSTECSRSCS